MLKQEITFTDFNGTQRTQTLYFNLTEVEIVDLQAGSEAGLEKEMQDAIDSHDIRKILDFVKMIIDAAYGEKTEDGLRFRKSPEILQAFKDSPAYSDLLMSLFENEGERSAAFITGLMPADLVARAAKRTQAGGGQVLNARERFAAAQQAKNIPEAVVETPKPWQQSRAAASEESVQDTQPNLDTYNPVVQSENSPQDAAPVQVEAVTEEAKPFKVREEPMDPDYADFLKQKEARRQAELDDRQS